MKAEQCRCVADLNELDRDEKIVLAASPASGLQVLSLQLLITELVGHLQRDWNREVIEADVALTAAGIRENGPSGLRTLADRIQELAARTRRG